MQTPINYYDQLWKEIMARRKLHRTIPWSYPPTKCVWCNTVGIHNFFKDTIKVTTYRCRMCGHEHYNDVIYLKRSDPKIGGWKV